MSIIKRKNQPEYILQKACAKWLSYQYSDLYFRSDTVASVRLTKPQAARNKAIQKSDFQHPDIVIYAMRKGYGALFIELKSKSPYLKNGELSKDEHIQGQYRTMQKLEQSGYKCYFAWELEQFMEIVSEYMSGN